MPTAQLRKVAPETANTSVKLTVVQRERIRSLALFKQRSSHFLMKEAVNRYLEEEEREMRAIEIAEEAYEHYERTGLHTTHEEMSAWVDKLQMNPKAQPPVCHI